jgi:hypothetical protein
MINIKQSYVHQLPADRDNPFDSNGKLVSRWVACSSGSCGYERSAFESSYMIRNKDVLLRMYKVNGQQVCEGCIKEAIQEMQEWIDDGEEE